MKEKDKLLDLLDDLDVINKIKKIVLDNNPIDQSKDKQCVYSEQELQIRIEKLKKECEVEASKKIEVIQEKCEILLAQMQDELNREKESAKDNERIRMQIEEKYNEAEKIYSIYTSLDSTQLRWFDRVLHADASRADSPIDLIVWATQKDNLVSMWEIITSHMTEIIENNQNEMFCDLFEASFKLYASTTRGKAFLVIPGIGTEYDPLKHSKTSKSRSLGKITKVVLPGYCIGNESNKPIVEVE